MKKWQRYFVLFLRIVGSTALLAIFGMIMPYSWMDAVHQWLGWGELPSQPVVGYLARSTSALYAVIGGLLWVVSFDCIRHRLVVLYVGAVFVVLAVALLVVDIVEGLPLYWTLGEAIANLGTGAIMVAGGYFLREQTG